MIINPPAPAGTSTHRLKRGTKSSDVPLANGATGSKDELLNSIDGPFQLAEYLACKVRADPHDVKGLVEVPKDGQAADRDVWVYEHLRRIPVDLAPLVSQLLTVCSRDTCPRMKADEWLYLCVAHGSGGTEECCAIDYILHTLDSTTTLLNSTKSFPSRMSIPASSLNNFPSLSRRLSRIFSHAYFHHREAFLTFEAESSLYERFMVLCETYGLVGSSLLIIPKGELGIGGHGEDDDEEEDEEAEEEEEREVGKEKEDVGGRAGAESSSSSESESESGSEGESSGDEQRPSTLSDRPGETAEPITTDTSAQPANQPDLRKPDGASSRPRRSVVPRASAVAAAQAKHNGASKHVAPESTDPTATAKQPADPTDSPTAVQSEATSAEKDDIVIPETAIKASLRGKGTLGKSIKKRGTVLWSSDSVDEDKEAEVGAEHQDEDDNVRDKEDGDAITEKEKAMPVQEEGRLL